jgi:murein hydrolase activator
MLKILLLILLFSICILPQEQNEILIHRDELSDLRSEIKRLEKEISEKSRSEKKTFETLESMKKQSFVLSRMVNTLKKDEEQKTVEINKTTSDITMLEKRITLLKKNYAKSITGLYKYGKPSGLAIMLDSENINQALVRQKYLQRFSERRKSDLTHLNSDIEKLSLLKSKLVKEKREKELLANEKIKEEANLKAKMNQSSRLITEIRKNKTELKKEIDSRRKAEVKIASLIEKLVAEAERKKKEEKERLARLSKEADNKEKTVKGPVKESTYDIDLNTSGFTSFSAMRGKLTWPLQNGKITGRFGENRHRLLKTVTLNYGVDILAGKDPNVRAVADGVVSAIDWIPGYGSVIIITHAEDYRTVYSRLSEIYVTEGDKVQSGKLIAKVGESLEGNILHFEIWSSRTYQNPESWLAKK